MDKLVYCEHCEKKVNYYVDTELATREVKDLEITLSVPVPKCIKCNNEVFSLEEDTIAQDLFFREYKKQKGLIQTEEIELIRNGMNLSQRDFSRLLGFGEITISRYETGSIPTKSNSLMIESAKERLTVERLFNENKEMISPKGQQAIQSYLEKTDPIKYTGNRQYSIEKFNQLTAFFIDLFHKNNERVYTTKLNKLLFYTDFNFFRKFGASITGSKYIKLSYGPVPSHYDFKYDMNPLIITICENDSISYNVKEEIQYPDLSSDELKIAEAVYKRFIECNCLYVSNASHNEEAWINTEQGKEISYELSNKLKITV